MGIVIYPPDLLTFLYPLRESKLINSKVSLAVQYAFLNFFTIITKKQKLPRGKNGNKHYLMIKM